jgi:Flp pilus assembly protein TadG
MRLVGPGLRAPRRRGGAAAAELAVLLPILGFLLVAMTDFARLFYYASVVNTCARNGALYASQLRTQANSQYASVTAAATADAPDLSPAPTVTATYSSTATPVPYTGTTPLTSGYVEVTVTWTFHTLVTYPGISNSVTLTGTARMEILQ